MKARTDVITSMRGDYKVGEKIEGQVIVGMKVIPADPKAWPPRPEETYEYTVKRRTAKEKKRDADGENGYTRIDLSSMSAVSGKPLVTFRRICRGM